MTVPQTLSSTTSRRDARIKFEISPILPTDLCPANPTQIIVQSVIPVLCCHREESHKNLRIATILDRWLYMIG